MVFLNQSLLKYYGNLGICYILYYLDIHQKKLKSIQPLFLNIGAQLLFAARSMESMEWGVDSTNFRWNSFNGGWTPYFFKMDSMEWWMDSILF